MKRFAYILHFADQDSKVMDPVKQGLPLEMPKEVRHEVAFNDLGNGKTEVTVTEYGWTVGQLMEMSKMGLEQCLDKLAAVFAE